MTKEWVTMNITSWSRNRHNWHTTMERFPSHNCYLFLSRSRQSRRTPRFHTEYIWECATLFSTKARMNTQPTFHPNQISFKSKIKAISVPYQGLNLDWKGSRWSASFKVLWSCWPLQRILDDHYSTIPSKNGQVRYWMKINQYSEIKQLSFWGGEPISL